MKKNSHAFVNQLVVCLLVTMTFGGSIGLGTVWMRHQISVTANTNRQLAAKIDDVERRIEEMTTVLETEKRPVLGIAARATRTYYRNLVHCGRDVVPGLGIEGEYVAGLAAARNLANMAGRRWRA